MLEFKIMQELKPNTEILEIIKGYTYITKSALRVSISDLTKEEEIDNLTSDNNNLKAELNKWKKDS